MDLTRLLPHTVSVVGVSSGVTVDAYGNPTAVTAAGVTVQARMWQIASTEVVTGRDTTGDHWRVILPVTVVLDAGDRIVWNGKTFDVDGTPDLVYAATDPHHIEAALRYTGAVA